MMILVKINKMPGNIMMDCISVDTYDETDDTGAKQKCYCFADLTTEGELDPDKIHILRYHIREDELILVRELEIVPYHLRGRIGVLDSAVREILSSTLGDKYKTGEQIRKDAWAAYEQGMKDTFSYYHQFNPMTRYKCPDQIRPGSIFPFQEGIEIDSEKDPKEGGITYTASPKPGDSSKKTPNDPEDRRRE